MSESPLRRDVLAVLMPGFTGETMPAWVAEAFEAGMRSVCVYGENVRGAEQLRALGAELRAACPEALIAIDEEGGEVTRLHYLEGSPYPGAAVLGRIDDTDYTERIGERVGRDVLASGFNLALGPIADVNSDPRNPVIGTRSFGADPELAARHVSSWIEGLQRTGAIACAKHFPGHGDTSQDSHLALPTVDAAQETLERRELPPFRAAIGAGVGAIMTSHILLPRIDPSGPATFSRIVLQGMLRDELEFEGVIVSDALDMRGASGGIGIPEAAVRALIAGCDLLCLGTGGSPAQLDEIDAAVRAAIENGRLGEDRLAEAASRVRALCETAAGRTHTAPPTPGEVSVSPDPSAELDRVASAFDGLEDARVWLAAHPAAAVIRVDAEANMAVGHAPWGPFAAGLEASREAPGADAEAWRLHYPHGAIVIGRELHRLPFAVDGLETLRASGAHVLVVEMGWPEERPPMQTGAPASRPDPRPVHDFVELRCYGSSRLVGAALLRLIEGDPA